MAGDFIILMGVLAGFVGRDVRELIGVDMAADFRVCVPMGLFVISGSICNNVGDAPFTTGDVVVRLGLQEAA
jgi:hypothetical protein